MSETQDPLEKPVPGIALPEIPPWLCLSLLAAFVLVILRDVLFFHTDQVLSDKGWDLNYYFIHWRYFGFHELASGNLPLWNPHSGSGSPFFGNFQSALLYPLNFLYLLLPLEPAINWTIAMHLFLGGAFVFYWVRHRGLHTLACLLSAMMFTFCGPQFLQIQTGHLPNLATLIWAPLLFLAIDKIIERPALAPCLLGMFAFAMAVLAGHPQYVFYLGIASGIYCVLNLLHAQQRGKIILGLAAIVLGGIGLSAIQLFTGLQEGGESMRSLGVPYQFASSYSFPPENFLTLVAPWFFGDATSSPYWGRWYLTEVSVFVSVIGLVVAVYGMVSGPPAVRRFSITMLIVAFVLALGCYTPVFHLLYNYAPGFNKFRGMDKFLWLAALFLSMLAGVGMDQLLRQRTIPRGLIAGAAGAGVILMLMALFPVHLDWWARLIKLVPEYTTLWPSSYYSRPDFISLTSKTACNSLLAAAVTLLAAAAVFELARSRRNIACLAMLLLAAFELGSFARNSLVTFTISPPDSPAVLKMLAENPGDYRIQAPNPNSAMTAGTFDICDVDPTGLLRYNRFLYFTRGVDFDTYPYGTPPPSSFDTNTCRMLRCRYFLSIDERSYLEVTNVLPQLLLVDQFRVMTNYHEIFSTLTNASFDMNREVILENQPDPLPQPTREHGTVKLLDSSTDYLDIEADVAAPTLLLVTDSYSSGWRAVSRPGSSQAQYNVMPANYCLRVIPLAAGHHVFRLEYSPLGFRIGKTVSIVTSILFLALCGLAVFNHRRQAVVGIRA